MTDPRIRVFIVGPASQGDTLHHVCTTKSKRSLDDIYFRDKFTIVDSTNTLESAIVKAKEIGSKRPTII